MATADTPSWEDELELLDLKWKSQQMQTFKVWCNNWLRASGDSVESIENDFRDGLRLLKLVEAVSGEKLPKPDLGKLRVHKIANVGKCIQFMQDKGVPLVSISAEDIVDGNVKMTLGLMWKIILHFDIRRIKVKESTADDALLLWCRIKTANYDNVNVQNFDTSFKDGLAVCALIHSHCPDLINFVSLTKEDPAENWELALDAAEKHLDIPRMINVKDMLSCEKPDKMCVMTMVAALYRRFTEPETRKRTASTDSSSSGTSDDSDDTTTKPVPVTRNHAYENKALAVSDEDLEHPTSTERPVDEEQVEIRVEKTQRRDVLQSDFQVTVDGPTSGVFKQTYRESSPNLAVRTVDKNELNCCWRFCRCFCNLFPCCR